MATQHGFSVKGEKSAPLHGKNNWMNIKLLTEQNYYFQALLMPIYMQQASDLQFFQIA